MNAPLILGAGPAGCAAAIALAEVGRHALLLDRDAQPRDALCGGFLSWRTAEQLRTLGIDPAPLGAMPITHAALFAGSRTLRLALPGRSWGLSRRVLDEALRRRAIALGTRFEVDTARGLEPGAVTGRSRSWPNSGLFLATGKHDVRGWARPRDTRNPTLGLRLRLRPSPMRERLIGSSIELHLFGGGYAGVVLQEDGCANVCLALRKALLARHGGEPARLLAGLAADHPAFAARLGHDWSAQPVETIGAVPYGWVAEETEEKLFRLGDQAAVIPSLAGEGIGIALASGAMAARSWLDHGSAGAPAYQRHLARTVRRPMRAARWARQLAESPLGAAAGLALARSAPALLRALMDASRIEPAASLAQPAAAP